MRKWILSLVALLMVGLVVVQALADTVKLKDGSTVEGTVIKFGDTYRVKLTDGTTRVIPVAQVASIVKGSVPDAPAPAPAGKATSAAPAKPDEKAAPTSVSFQAVKQRADAVEAAILGVTIWEEYIEGNPTSPDIETAKAELEKWKKLSDENAEKINGKWVGGDDRKKLMKEVNKLCEEAREQMESQTLQAIEKYQKAIKLYPNCFEANFAMGYYHLKKGAYGSTGKGNNAEIDAAIRSLEIAVRLRPDSPETLSNLAIGYAFKQKWEQSVVSAHKACKIEDSKELVENLVNLLVWSPQGMKSNNKKVKPIIEEATILAQKYGIGPQGTGHFTYLPPRPPKADVPGSPEGSKDEGPPGIIGNGSGFLVSADGYIITNRHVVEEQNRLFRVRFDDGKEKSAEVIAIDNEQDIALIKIKTDKPLPFLKIAGADLPNPGSKCMVLGYPVADMLNFKMQVTSGEVTSTDAGEKYEVTLTANTTHGNSGGPIVDRDGHVIGVLSAGQQAYNATYVKALSAGQIRRFLERARDKYTNSFDPGAATDRSFDGEALALEARKSTLLILIIRGDGKVSTPDSVRVGEKKDE